MLRKPVLAKCDNRAQLARTNPTYGEPDQWMTSTNLASLGLAAVSFDFFIDWNGNPLMVGDELWVKRISDVPVGNLRPEDVRQGALACGDDLKALEAFSNRYGFTPRYMVFEEGVNWANAPTPLLVTTLNGAQFLKGSQRTLNEVMGAIRQFSGGPVSIGGKGLFYGTSSLECYLSKTTSLWPGDADCVLWDSNQQCAVALLEFKKHNLDTPLAQEGIQKYMAKDRRKWERLGLLRDHLNVPLSCIYYSTDPAETQVKIERLVGPYNSLQSGSELMLQIAGMSHAALGKAVAQVVV